MKMDSSPVPTKQRRLCVLSDIDGTLSVPAVRVMISALGRFHKVIFVTYRFQYRHDSTQAELRALFPDLPYLLLMRQPMSDVSNTPIAFKSRIIRYVMSEYEPIVYFEDDPVVVAWATKEGLPVISCR